MRIGVAALGRLSEDTGGKNYIVHFVAGLDRAPAGMQFVLFVSPGEAEAIGIVETQRLRIVAIPNSSRTPLHKVIGEQVLLPKYIRSEAIDAMYFPGNFISLRSKVPAVVNIRATAHFYGSQYGIHGVRRFIRKLLMPASARIAKLIITPSEDIKKDVVRFTGAHQDKIHVVPHGVDTSLFDGESNRTNPEGQNILERFDLEEGNYLLYVSALWRYKNQDKLIQAHAKIAKRHPNLKLVIAGMGTGTEKAYLDLVHSLPGELGTEKLVVFTGGLKQSELRYLYANARAFVFPSSYESFGNPIFEAWASGIPVATSSVHSFPEVVADAGLLFDPLKEDSMIEAIERLITDDSLRAELILKGRDRVKFFTWERCVERTLSLIASVRA